MDLSFSVIPVTLAAPELHGPPQHEGRTSVAVHCGACVIVSFSHPRVHFSIPKSQWYSEGHMFQKKVDRNVHLATSLVYITCLATPDLPYSLRRQESRGWGAQQLSNLAQAKLVSREKGRPGSPPRCWESLTAGQMARGGCLRAGGAFQHLSNHFALAASPLRPSLTWLTTFIFKKSLLWWSSISVY